MSIALSRSPFELTRANRTPPSLSPVTSSSPLCHGFAYADGSGGPLGSSDLAHSDGYVESFDAEPFADPVDECAHRRRARH